MSCNYTVLFFVIFDQSKSFYTTGFAFINSHSGHSEYLAGCHLSLLAQYGPIIHGFLTRISPERHHFSCCHRLVEPYSDDLTRRKLSTRQPCHVLGLPLVRRKPPCPVWSSTSVLSTNYWLKIFIYTCIIKTHAVQEHTDKVWCMDGDGCMCICT